MNGKFLKAKEVKKVLELLEKQWGFTKKLDYVWFLSNKQNLYIVNREFAHVDVSTLRISSFGMYFGEITMKNDVRLSIEGSQFVGAHATKHVLELDGEQVRQWMYGNDVTVADTLLQGFYILKHDTYYLGCGSCKEGV